MTAESRDVLVFGGTGRLGAPIVAGVAEAGYPVTVFARASSDRQRLSGLSVDYVIGDLLDGESVREALSGREFAYVIDASARGASAEPFYADAMRNILAGLEAGSVQQFILHGSVGAGDNARQFPDIDFSRMQAVMTAKGEAEQLLIDSGIPYTIIRNAIVRRDGTPATGTATLTLDQGTFDAVTRLDLAALTLECLGNPDCLNRVFHAVDEDSGATND